MIPHLIRTAFVLLGLLSATGALAVREDTVICWLPRGTPPARLSPAPALYFEGLSGFAVGAAPAEVPALTAAGGRVLGLEPGESLYAFLLEDAERAAFELPARVLVRAGREVLVATDGEVPRLTAEADQALTGLKQPVRIDLAPRPAVAKRANPGGPLAVSRGLDPLIQGMVNQLTTTTLVPTWQALDDFDPRETFQPNNLLASQWMLETFRSYGLRAEFHYYSQSGQKRNVIATLPGQVDSTKVVYICGHFDATTPTPTTCAPGADDNGSGTAAVLETARILSHYRFEFTIKFACFNGEEQGLVGSLAYVAARAAAGEEIIAVYNCDMIAYRGTDPAPADLVIYTNTASQAVAAILADAINTYVPGQIEPVVHVHPLSGSDHASFWGYGYPAVLAIEDEAWDSDFCPWYHTCDDRIERYPHDYIVSCAKACLAAVAMTAVPIAPPASEFRRSDLDGSNELNISDPIYNLAYQFAGGPAPSCLDAADDDDSGEINIADPIYSLAYQFAGGPPPPAPFLSLGPDPTPDGLGCTGLPIGGSAPAGKLPMALVGDWDESVVLSAVQMAGDGSIRVPVVVHSSSPLSGLEFAVGYRSDLLEFRSLESGADRRYDFLAATAGKGLVRIGCVPDVRLVTPLGAGEHRLCSLVFEAKPDQLVEGSRFEITSGRFVAPDLRAIRPRGQGVTLASRGLPDADAPSGPAEVRLRVPSPYRAGAAIRLEVPDAPDLSIRLFDVRGRAVRDLFADSVPAGRLELAWDGRTDGGDQASAGIYYLRVVLGTQRVSRAVLLVK
jgi:hypothetical protein